MAGSDEHDKKPEGDLVEAGKAEGCETVNLAAAAGWTLGAAVRTLADGVDRITVLLGPRGKAQPKKKAPAEPIAPLLDQLGKKVSEQAKRKSYAALAEDDGFWEVLERLMRHRARRPPALAPASDAPEPAKTKAEALAEARGEENTAGDAVVTKSQEPPVPAEVESEEFDDPLAGVLEEEQGEGEAEDRGKGKKKDKQD